MLQAKNVLIIVLNTICVFSIVQQTNFWNEDLPSRTPELLFSSLQAIVPSSSVWSVRVTIREFWPKIVPRIILQAWIKIISDIPRHSQWYLDNLLLSGDLNKWFSSKFPEDDPDRHAPWWRPEVQRLKRDDDEDNRVKINFIDDWYVFNVRLILSTLWTYGLVTQV